MPATPAQRSSKRAEVAFTSGQLTIKADNSSLNLILREIGRQTGIKITGGVPEERVFGTYGPGAPDVILAELLDGAGSNMLLIASDGTAPGELVLTPRMGGPTPPNPNAKGFDDDSVDDDAPRPPAPRGVTLFGAQPPVPQAETAPQQPNQFPPVTPPSPDAAPAAPANAQSPNGVKTPQEIYQQLQMLRQQQQQQQQAEPPDAPG